MSRNEKIIAILGLILFMFGAGTIDSPNMIPSIVAVIAGLGMFAPIGWRYKDEFEDEI